MTVEKLLWSLAVGGFSPAFLMADLQEELLSRGSKEALLQAVWSSSYSELLSEGFLRRSKEKILKGLDSEPQPVIKKVSEEDSLDERSPRLLKLWSDRLVLHKPAGWQVDDSCGPVFDPERLLSVFLKRLLPSLLSLRERRGFLHRLDVPTSGLILVATSQRAYYDLQLQLSSRRIRRDYVVLVHGITRRGRIDARVHWLEDAPDWFSGSRVLPYGKPACSLLQTLEVYTKRLQSSLSLIEVHILTGRCHQIRLHSSHVGHPSVTDARYSSAATFEADSKLCKRNFLHRYGLSFYSSPSWTHYEEVHEELPRDLQDALTGLRASP